VRPRTLFDSMASFVPRTGEREPIVLVRSAARREPAVIEGRKIRVKHELSRAIGLGGRHRKAGSAAERARVNVSRAIAAAVKKIAEEHPALGEHLAARVHTGTFCSYPPDPLVVVDWKF
jgi:hypothetical protein